MSKAFTKDDVDAAETLVPARAPLPEGTPNYVTPRGLALLRAERNKLAEGRAHAVVVTATGATDAGAAVVLDMKLAELDLRLASAELVDPKQHPDDRVRFGAVVSVEGDRFGARRLEIVGVDEADPRAGKIAFVAPLARALLGKESGDVVEVRAPGGIERLEIVEITYPPAHKPGW